VSTQRQFTPVELLISRSDYLILFTTITTNISMRFILTASFVSFISLSLAVPVPVPTGGASSSSAPARPDPQHGDITRVRGIDLNNQGPSTKPNNVFNADGTRVSVFSSVWYIYHLSCLDVQRPMRGYAHNGVVVDGPGPKGDYGIAPVSHNLPADIYPHKDDATRYSSQFDAGSQISTGVPVRANKAVMNKQNQPLGSIGSQQLQDLKDKIGMQHSFCYTHFSLFLFTIPYDNLTTDFLSHQHANIEGTPFQGFKRRRASRVESHSSTQA
jgi:hypothetical protein